MQNAAIENEDGGNQKNLLLTLSHTKNHLKIHLFCLLMGVFVCAFLFVCIGIGVGIFSYVHRLAA